MRGLSLVGGCWSVEPARDKVDITFMISLDPLNGNNNSADGVDRAAISATFIESRDLSKDI